MPSLKDLAGLQDVNLQRAVLETFVTMHVTDPRLQGWTHVRCEQRGGSIRWLLLDADEDSVRNERDVNLGSDANNALIKLMAPYVRGQPWELARVTVRFNPPRMTIDVLNDTNTPLVTGELIDLHIEQQVRDQMAILLGKNR